MKFQRKNLTVLFAACLLFAMTGCHHRANKPGDGNDSLIPVASGPAEGIQLIPGRLSIAAMDRRVPVIMFHDVIPQRGPGSVYFDDTLANFTAQIQFIHDNGLVPITIKQLYDHLSQGAQIPPNAICLTFDDNYLGFYKYAYPILKQFNYPAAMFVHTNYVGDLTGGHPKMNWDQLQELVKGGLVTIGGHTESHPLDLSVLTDHQQATEIAGSKTILEKHLGVPIDFMAWPNGKFNQTSIDIATKAGYKMVFAMNEGFAEESPNMYSIHRYGWEKLQAAVQARDQLVTDAPVAIDQNSWVSKPVQLHVQTIDGLLISYVTGGMPQSLLSDMRQGVQQFVENSGAAAGVNGGFFAMASLYSTSNVMIGPCYTSDKKQFTSGTEAGMIERLKNRPVVLWSDHRIAIVPFQPDTMDDEAIYRAFMPNFTNLFVAGGWMVHQGIPMTDDQMLEFDSKDLADPRRRVFFGWMKDGTPVAGASLQTCTTERLAQVAAEAGVQDAVLLDSGFSTSVVFNDKIIVTGHTARDIPSRPVPHAIVFMGQIDLTDFPANLKLAAIGAIDPSDVVGARRGKLKRRTRVRTLVPLDDGSPVKVKELGGDGSNPGDTRGTEGTDTTGGTGATSSSTSGSTGSNSGGDSGSGSGSSTDGSGTSGSTGTTGSTSGDSGSTSSGSTSAGSTGKTGP